ncbi:hypothetical protein DF186_19755, partial [Enterococcus hirae]
TGMLTVQETLEASVMKLVGRLERMECERVVRQLYKQVVEKPRDRWVQYVGRVMKRYAMGGERRSEAKKLGKGTWNEYVNKAGHT